MLHPQERTASIESKMQRIDELAVSIVHMKNDLPDTEEAFFFGLAGERLHNKRQNEKKL